MFKRFIAYYKPHKKLFALDMFASLLVSLLGLVYPIITRSMLNDLIPNKKYQLIVIFGCSLLVIYLIRMLLRYFVQYYGHIVGTRMQHDMREDMFAKLQMLPYDFYDNHQTGKIMSRMTNDLNDVCELAHHGPENIFISGIMIIGSFIYLMTINVYLTLIVFASVPALVIITLVLRKKMNQAFTESRVKMAVINASLESSISGIRVTKAYTNSQKEIEKFEIGNGQFVKARGKAFLYMAKFFASTNFVTDIFNVIILIAGGLFLYNGLILVGDYPTFIVSVNLFIGPVTSIINFVEQYQDGVSGFKRFVEILDQPAEQDSPSATELTNVKGEISFENVSFTYKEGKEVLHNISFKVVAGEKLALVGPSGGGKTTICHLLPAFYSNQEGTIRIDDVDIKTVTKQSLRKNIGIVQQDVFLFNGSIKENILYGRLDATEEEVIEAAKKANIHEYVMTLENGYDTQIGERGVRLSGGQKQRLSIARVFLKDPSILILDEATSSLDNTTELIIQKELDELCVGRTTIVVAHRLSTIRNADQIMVIGQGNVIEQGSHESLLETNGVYKQLYELQFRNSSNTYLSFEL
ncbi:MAG: ABC transporter ATP-binding protein [Clostridia bacterium]